ncbi:glycosyltransferase family 2 protein [Microbacterium sp. NPDC078428]|uniref:glycosyltransferase family 2 protein n=1 Tax=Microbacterium sp. NPDC078428 TaxID=3364190 RepID=UPI0037C788AF
MINKLPISVLVQTKNEEDAIEGCLQSLRDFDEVIVVDSNSTDRTAEIAKSCGARVVTFSWNGSYPKKKQWAIESVSTAHSWLFFLDADESPTPQLVADLKKVFATPLDGIAAFDIELDYVFSGRRLRFGHRVTKRCLVRRESVTFPVVDDLAAPGMGELEGHYQPQARGDSATLRGRLLHNDPDPVSSWFARHNRYSDWEAYLRDRPSTRASVRGLKSRQGKLFDRVPFKPVVFFLYTYVARLGLLDGRAGLDYAIALSFYYWQIQLKVRELRREKLRCN